MKTPKTPDGAVPTPHVPNGPQGGGTGGNGNNPNTPKSPQNQNGSPNNQDFLKHKGQDHLGFKAGQRPQPQRPMEQVDPNANLDRFRQMADRAGGEGLRGGNRYNRLNRNRNRRRTQKGKEDKNYKDGKFQHQHGKKDGKFGNFGDFDTGSGLPINAVHPPKDNGGQGDNQNNQNQSYPPDQDKDKDKDKDKNQDQDQDDKDKSDKNKDGDSSDKSDKDKDGDSSDKSDKDGDSDKSGKDKDKDGDKDSGKDDDDGGFGKYQDKDSSNSSGSDSDSKDKDSDDLDGNSGDKDKDKDSDDDLDGGKGDKDKDDSDSGDKDKDSADKDGKDKDSKDKDGKGKDKDKGFFGKLAKKMKNKAKLGKAKKLKDLLKLADKNLDKQGFKKGPETRQLRNLIQKILNIMRRLLRMLIVYLQALRMWLLYKLAMLLRELMSHIFGWMQTVWNVIVGVATVVAHAAVFVCGGWIAALGAAIFGAVVLLVTLLLTLFAGIQQQSNQMQQALYQELCENGHAKGDKTGDDSGTDTSTSTGGKVKKISPLPFKEYKDHRKNAISMSKAVAKKVGIPTSWAFAQIYAEETTYITGGQLQPVVTEDHNLTGMGPVPGIQVGSGHGEGDGSYGHYENFHQFAAAWAYTLKRMVPHPPKSAYQYVTELHNHTYFTAPLQSYWANFSSGLNNYKNGGSTGGASGAVGDAISSAVHNAVEDFCKGAKDDSDSGSGWGWPFASIKGGKHAKLTFLEGGQYGHTSYSRGETNFHDGVDWSNGENGVHFPAKVLAVHAGTIHKVGKVYGWYYIWEKTGDYNIIYQEAFNGEDSFKVKAGDKVKRGQAIATADNTGSGHLHLGITTNKRNPTMNQIQNSAANGYDHPECWLNPVKVIRNGYGKGGDTGDDSGSSSINNHYANKVRNKESGGNYKARNGKYYGAWQLDISYLKHKTYGGDGSLSKKNQDKVAINYMKNRYGSWKKAWEHELSANWW